ncbi:Nse4 C-terminal-domain-containing protein [Catenaria anguillulae PL171]|uniref:Non-structural maintenance of chromosomes element 4 n=1 Tax=Catenaria anguillulae PL171 TaxID=765915 RepID=A0A1Y2I1T3_9FUNG|nr:Nse4 C-terminal-domain-containing protein [Catenaria anguillulae PL171]
MQQQQQQQSLHDLDAPRLSQLSQDHFSQLSQADTQEAHKIRRQTRAQIRRIAETLETNRAEYVENPKLLNEHLDHLDHLQKNVLTTSESALDSRVLLTSTQIVHERIMSLKLGRAMFNMTEFVTKVLNHAADRPGESLAEIGNHFAPFMARAPALEVMMGPMDVVVKKREVVKRAAREVAAKQIAKTRNITEHTQQASGSDSAQTRRFVRQTHQILMRLRNQDTENGGVVPLFEFILHPRSYAQTVENMFFVSFLIKDGIAVVRYEDQGDIVLWGESQEEVKQKIDEANKNGTGERRSQWIPSITLDEWRELVDLYGLRGQEPKYIPNRDYSGIQDYAENE